ncbi:phosphatase PAP2 family protein [Ruegeria sp. 2012CJ41-6]|uniref:Phosphatase PAP2 family protein n=1 Tax=Ruegeria spongiae TaxID=2942209 RepID=A0ABT0Q5N4_9RHOB|nr:phosphatase PAP2 family protein [Ruegeria spongiae]MCL6285120.1 phosphatase PAP2 family protein [Ruegeria spongiae]
MTPARSYLTAPAFAAGLALLTIGVAQPSYAATERYLPEGSVNATELIPPPPEMNSAAFDTQMAIVEWAQVTRTPEQVEFVETPLTVERFWPILGSDMFTVDAAGLKTVIDQSINEVRSDYDALKSVYDLPRPFVVNEAVNPIGDVRPVASYPSGHSIRAVVYARLLSEAFPEHEVALIDLAEQVGHGRVTGGVHYPMDIIAGQTLGHAYADAIIANPAFQDAIAQVRLSS